MITVMTTPGGYTLGGVSQLVMAGELIGDIQCCTDKTWRLFNEEYVFFDSAISGLDICQDDSEPCRKQLCQ